MKIDTELERVWGDLWEAGEDLAMKVTDVDWMAERTSAAYRKDLADIQAKMRALEKQITDFVQQGSDADDGEPNRLSYADYGFSQRAAIR